MAELVVSPIPVETTEFADCFRFSTITQFVAAPAGCFLLCFFWGFLVLLTLVVRRSFY